MARRRPSPARVLALAAFVAVVLLAGWCAVRLAGAFDQELDAKEGPFVDPPSTAPDVPNRPPADEPRSR